jgi:hypothetical protein
MVYYIILFSIISLCIIGIFHYLYNYLKNNYTTSKKKDVIHFYTKKYEELLNEQLNNNNNNNNNNNTKEFVSEFEKIKINDDLLLFAKELTTIN